MTPTPLTAEAEALLRDIGDDHFGYRERLAVIEAAARREGYSEGYETAYSLTRHVRETGCEGLRGAARDVWEHWAHGIGWFDGYDGTRPDKTAIHLTQMTVEDEQEMTRRMDVLAECLGLGERYYEGAALAPTVAAEGAEA